MIYFLVILAAIVVAAFFIPIKIVIYTNLKGNNVYYVDNSDKENDVTITIKILGFVPVYRYKKGKNKKKKKNNKSLSITDIMKAIKESLSKEELKINDLTKKLFKWGERVKFHKLILIGGFNTEDYVKNAYINASVNSIICMFINANQDNFNLKKLYYQVSISDYNYYLALDTVLTFPFINNVDVLKTIIRIIYNLKGRKFDKNKNKSDEKIYNTKYLQIHRKYDLT